jgi:uncharacterized membrane protein YqjE
MQHPLLHLIATRPQLLAEHAEAYAGLWAVEAGQAAEVWRRRALFGALAVCGVGVAAVLAGVALMLWLVTPAAQLQAAWPLVVIPLVPLLAAAACLAAVRRRAADASFATLREQLRADLAVLREAGASS